jgi:cell division protein FtsW (lipid II flippase)
MIFIKWQICAGTALLTLVFLSFSTVYAYQVNAKKEPGESGRKNYSPHSVWMAPIIVPFLFIVNAPFFILGSLAFGAFLVIFPFTLLLFQSQESFLTRWMRELTLKIGTALLEINTELLVMAGLYRPPTRQTSAS